VVRPGVFQERRRRVPRLDHVVGEALRREPRIEQVELVSVTQDPLQPDRLLITATVKAAGDVAPLNLAFAFSTDRSVAGE
jgi:hypothetical protein